MDRYLKTKGTKLLGFDPEWNFSRINLKRVTADILPNSGYKHDILDTHLPSLR
jgi:hypothetical protein